MRERIPVYIKKLFLSKEKLTPSEKLTKLFLYYCNEQDHMNRDLIRFVGVSSVSSIKSSLVRKGEILKLGKCRYKAILNPSDPSRSGCEKRRKKIWVGPPKSTLNRTDWEIFYIFKEKVATNGSNTKEIAKYIMKTLNKARSTVWNSLGKLCSENYINRVGKGRYTLKSNTRTNIIKKLESLEDQLLEARKEMEGFLKR